MTDFFKKYNIPTVCPVCGDKVEINSSGIPFCVNDNCDQKTAHRILTFSELLQIKGIGDQFAEDWVKIGHKNFVDLIVCIIEADNGNKSAMSFICNIAGGINGEKIVANTMKAFSPSISTAILISMFDLDGFSEKRIQSLIDAGYTYETLWTEANPRTIAEIKGWTIDSGVKFLQEYAKIKDDVFKVASLIKIEDKKVSSESKLVGKSFCFTGALNSMKRADAEKLVKKNGGTIAGVSKNLTYLVNNDIESTSGKNKKAKNLGIMIIDEEQFLEMLK